MQQKPMIILTGPTAVGKSALSVELAKKINGAVISADSMQVYRHMDIGSAKITPEEMQGVTHYMIDGKRCNRVFLTKKGKQAIEPIKKSIEKWNSIVTKNMSDKEKKELKRLLSMAIENIKEEI